MKKIILYIAILGITFEIQAQTLQSPSYPGLRLTHNNAQARFWGSGIEKWSIGSSGDSTDNFLIYDLENNGVVFLINDNTGNIGIGTSNPETWKLAVNGNIRAKEIKVETGWSDFVFENDYRLPTLTEVESHIKKKGHLKDIPSAKEVAENGILLGEMNSKLLQKIEELTLYTIQQQKEIERLKLIEKRLSEIEKLLE